MHTSVGISSSVLGLNAISPIHPTISYSSGKIFDSSLQDVSPDSGFS